MIAAEILFMKRKLGTLKLVASRLLDGVTYKSPGGQQIGHPAPRILIIFLKTLPHNIMCDIYIYIQRLCYSWRRFPHPACHALLFSQSRVVGSSVLFLGVCSLSSLVWVFPFFFSCLVPNPTSFWATVLRAFFGCVHTI